MDGWCGCQGDFPVDGVAQLRRDLAEALPFLQASTIRRLIRQYGSEAQQIFAEAAWRGAWE